MLRTTVVIGDLGAVIAALAGCWLVVPSSEFTNMLLGPVGAVLLWPGILGAAGGYGPHGLAARDLGRQVGRAAVAMVALMAVLAAVLEQAIPMVAVAVAVPVLAVVSFGARRLAIRHLRRLRRAGVAVRRVLAVGPGDSVSELVDHLALVTDHAMVVVGACTEGGDLAEDIPAAGCIPPTYPGERSADTVATVVRAAADCEADTVCVVGGSRFSGDRLRELSWALRDADLDLMTSPGFVDVASHRLAFDRAGVVTLLHVRTVPASGLRRFGKALFDRVSAAVLLVALILPMTVIALTVRLTSQGPALFEQTRIGRNGRPFTMLKFRTMVVDAERLRDDLLPANEHDGVLFKLRNDPRVTGFGRFLRRSSLDELPQLVNVLLGEMSLVGPRPPLPEEVAQYGPTERRRLLVRPGMTGLWQVSGRSTLNWDETVRLDLRYVDNWTLGSDLRLLWRTIAAVVRGTGAY